MNQLEQLRKKLYEALDRGDSESIIQISRELDEIIILHMVQNGNSLETSK